MDKILLDITLEGLPPTLNLMYRGVNGHRYKTKICRDYQEAVTTIIKRQVVNKPCYTEKVALKVVYVSKDRRRWDMDNRLKALQDCLQLAGVIKDDSQIYLLILRRDCGIKDMTHITLQTYTDEKEERYSHG